MKNTLAITLLALLAFATPMSARDLSDAATQQDVDVPTRDVKATSYFPPIALLGLPYAHDIPNPSGTFGPVAWVFAGGSVPPGVVFSGSGVIQGIPLTAGSFTFNANYNDQSNNSGTYTITLSVLPNLITGSSQCALSANTGSASAAVLAASLMLLASVWVRRRRA